jgi:hypothetical protein
VNKTHISMTIILLVLLLLQSSAADLVGNQNLLDRTRHWGKPEEVATDLQYQAESNLVGAWYLTYPLQGLTSSSRAINTIFDHSVPTGWYTSHRDGVSVAWTGETGLASQTEAGANKNNGLYRNKDTGQDFSLNNLYTNGLSWGHAFLSYDGHPGLDLQGNTIVAPADGTLFVPTSDPINGSGSGTPESCYKTFAIDHGNGYQTWYLHAASHVQAGQVFRGDVIGTTGTTSCTETVGRHLHFEVRKKNVDGNYVPVDPYGWAGGCFKDGDPYKLAVNVNLWTNSGTNWDFSENGNTQGWAPNMLPDGRGITNIECFSVHDGAFYIDPSGDDPQIESPPLVNVSASGFDTVEMRMASNALDKNGAIYFITESSPTWSESKKVTFSVTNDGNFSVYSVKMSTNSLWTGMITGIRIDPSTSGISGTNSDTVGFDYIKLIDPSVGDGKAAITYPVPASTLSGSSVKFTWSAGSGVTQYYLYLGNSQGADDIYAQSQGTSLSVTVSGIPTDGRTIYVRLWSQFASGWDYNEYTYKAFSGSANTKAIMTNPAPGSTLSGSSATFTWSAGSGVTQYFLYLGNSQGANDIYAQSQGTSLSVTVSGIPTDGRTIYVRLWSLFASGWDYNDYTYEASGI